MIVIFAVASVGKELRTAPYERKILRRSSNDDAAAAPVAIAGFFHYNGMTLEQFLWAFIKSEILCAGQRRFDSVNLHEEVFASIMEDTLE